jgi:SNF2 family DNA or RNA helicase
MIRIDYKAPFFTLDFPYNKGDLKVVQNLPVREWNKSTKEWRVPRLASKSLEQINPPRTVPATWTDAAKTAKQKVEETILKLVDLKFQEGESDGLLRPYQTVGVEFLTFAKKGLLADDMGLGKSIQAIKAALNVSAKKVLVLCPASLKWKWADEFKKHFNIDAFVVAGTKPERRAVWKSDAQYIIANYELLLPQHDWDDMPHEWDVLIADEAVYLKNPKAQRTTRALRLQAEYKFALSGIYIENSLTEFFSIMKFVRPEVVPDNIYTFTKRYCEVDWNGKVIGAKKEKLPELHALTSPFVLRRTKLEKLAELPPKIYTPIPLEMSSEEKTEYSKLSYEFKAWVESGSKEEHKTVGSATLDVRYFVEGMYHKLSSFHPPANKTKRQWLEELYRDVDKVVVFTFFEKSARMLKEYFDTPYYISGKEKNNRFEVVKDFNKAKKGILVSTDAGKFGLDMVGADTLVHYGYVHNPGTMIQREDRLWRMGQEKTVNVLLPYLIGTIDEGIQKVYNARLVESQNFMEGSEQMQEVKLSITDYVKLIDGEYDE